MKDGTIIILALILAITLFAIIRYLQQTQLKRNEQECNLKKYQQYIFMLENSFPAEKNIEGKFEEIDKKNKRDKRKNKRDRRKNPKIITDTIYPYLPSL